MRRVLVVGAGQGALALALPLQRQGHEVTIVTDRTAEQVRRGRPMSTQLQFGASLAVERAWGMDVWQQVTPPIRTLNVTRTTDSGAPLLSMSGQLEQPASAVDQRIKFSTWLTMFEEAGGRLIVVPAESLHAERIEALCAQERPDLVVVAASRGPLAELFARDPQRSPRSSPARQLALVYLAGAAHTAATSWTTGIPGVGEAFHVPILSEAGLTVGLMIEAWPSGEWDVFGALAGDPVAVRQRMLDLLRQWVPAEYERCRSMPLTDSRAVLVGAVTPRVSRPVARLPRSGRPVLGLGDALVRNDPLTGQGANLATHAADLYRQRIEAHGDREFNAAWMSEVFEEFWATRAAPVTRWTSAMLAPGVPDHLAALLAAGAAHPEVADRFVRTYEAPHVRAPWLMDPQAVQTYLAGLGGQAASQTCRASR